jgi:hypothetical protein
MFIGSLCLLFVDPVIRECFLRMAQKEGGSAQKGDGVFGKPAVMLGVFFRNLLDEFVDRELVVDIYRTFVATLGFQATYNTASFGKFWESVLGVVDGMVDFDFMKQLLPKDSSESASCENMSRNAAFRLGVVASQFTTSKFSRKKCTTCGIFTECNVTKGVIECPKTASEQTKANGTLQSRFVSLFKKKTVIGCQEYMAASLAPFLGEGLRTNCVLCSNIVAGGSEDKPQVALATNFLLTAANPTNTTQIRFEAAFNFLLADAQVTDQASKNAHIYFLRSVTNGASATFFRTASRWYKLEGLTVTPCHNFDKTFEKLREGVTFAGYRHFPTETPLSSRLINGPAISLPLSWARFLDKHPAKAHTNLRALFCDHFFLKPSNFKLDYASEDALEDSKRAAINAFETLSIQVSKNVFFEALYKLSLLEKYAAHFEEMSCKEICQKCCRKENKRIILETLQASLKLKVLEQKKGLGQHFIRDNKDMIALTFSDDFVRRMGADLLAYRRSHSIMEKENAPLTLTSTFGLPNHRPMNLVEVFMGKKCDGIELSFGPSLTKFDSLIGQFEVALIESLVEAKETVTSSPTLYNLDMCQLLPGLKTAVSLATSSTTSIQTIALPCQPLAATIQSIVKQAIDYTPKSSKVEKEQEHPFSGGQPISPINRADNRRVLAIKPVDFTQPTKPQVSLFRRKPPQEDQEKKHFSATNRNKASETMNEDSCLSLGLNFGDFDQSDINSLQAKLPLACGGSVASSCDPMVSPRGMGSVLNRIEMSEFSQLPKRPQTMLLKMSKTPAMKRSVWKSHVPSENDDSISHHSSRFIETPPKFITEIQELDVACLERNDDTPALSNRVHFFNDFDHFAVFKPEGTLADDAFESRRPGTIKSNMKSKFKNPVNNSILTDISKSECSFYQRSVIEQLTARLEAETQARKKQHNPFVKMFRKAANGNMRDVVRTCTGVLKFELEVRLQHNVVKGAAPGFMLTIKKEPTAPVASKVINLARTELSEQKANSWKAITHSQAMSGSLTTPKKASDIQQSSIEKEAIVKGRDLGQRDFPRNIFLEKLDEVSEETKKSQAFSSGNKEGFLEMQAISLAKIDSRFEPFVLPGDSEPEDKLCLLRVEECEENLVEDCRPSRLGEMFLSGISKFGFDESNGINRLMTFNIEPKRLQGSPLGRPPTFVSPKKTQPLALINSRNLLNVIDKPNNQDLLGRRDLNSSSLAKCKALQGSDVKRPNRSKARKRQNSENVDPKRIL